MVLARITYVDYIACTGPLYINARSTLVPWLPMSHPLYHGRGVIGNRPWKWFSKDRDCEKCTQRLDCVLTSSAIRSSRSIIIASIASTAPAVIISVHIRLMRMATLSSKYGSCWESQGANFMSKVMNATCVEIL